MPRSVGGSRWFARVASTLVAAVQVFAKATAADVPAPASDAPAAGVLTPIPYAKPNRTGEVRFHREILPLLQANCLPCHNQTTTKGELSLETPEAMRKGGETGPALVPGNAAESLIVRLAAHAAKPRMPPKENKVKAVNLTPAELGLLALWIDQGAQNDSAEDAPIPWRSIPAEFASSFAAAVTADGDFAAIGRANQIHWYHLPTATFRGRLEDATTGKAVAQRDLVNALAFSPDGTWLASGGFREIKLWHRQPPAPAPWSELQQVTAATTSADGATLALSRVGGGISLVRAADGVAITNLPAADPPPTLLAFSSDGRRLAGADATGRLRVWFLDRPEARAEFSLGTNAQALTFFDADHQLAASLSGTPRVLTLQFTTNEPPSLTWTHDVPGTCTNTLALADAAPLGQQLLLGNDAGEVRLWAGETNAIPAAFSAGAAVTALRVLPESKRLLVATAQSGAHIWDLAPAPTLVRDLQGDQTLAVASQRADQRLALNRQEVDFQKAAFQRGEEDQRKQNEFLAKAQERFLVNAKSLAEKEAALAQQEQSRATTEKEKNDLAAGLQSAKEKLEAARRAADESKKAARDSESRDAALEELSKRAFAAGEAQSAADRANAELNPKLKAAETKLGEIAKALTDLKSQVDKARIQRDTSATDVQLAQRSLDRARAATESSRVALSRAEQSVSASEAEARAATAARDAAARRGYRWVAAPSAPAGCVTVDDGNRVVFWSDTGASSRSVVNLPKDARILAALGGDAVLYARGDRLFRLSAWPTWELVRTLPIERSGARIVDRVNALAFSPDGRWLASGGGEPSRSGELKLWNIADGTLVRDFGALHSDGVLGLAFSPDGETLASGGADRFVRLTDVASGRLLRNLEGHTHHVLAVAWSADGRTLASAGAEGVVKLWNAQTGERTKNVEGFGKEVVGLQSLGVATEFLATAGSGQARVFRADGSQIRTLPAGTAFLQSLAVTPDGRLAIAGDDQGTLRIWSVADGKSLAELSPPGSSGP